jgi:hypothetical protein
MTAKTRQILDIIEDALLAGHNSDYGAASSFEDNGVDPVIALIDVKTATELWNILSALRGPDNEELDAKVATIRIRATAFPRLAEAVRASTKLHGAGFANKPMFEKGDYMEGSEENPTAGGMHFEAHAYNALEDLR